MMTEEENYVRLALLVGGISRKAVQRKFDQHFPNLPNTVQTEYNKLNNLMVKKRITQAQWNLIYPSNDIPDSSTFDVMLMICLMRNLLKMKPPSNGFDCLPPPGEISDEADLARIKFYKNYLVHLVDTKISNQDFTSAWTDVADAVSRLGGTSMAQECQELKIEILDQSNIKEIMIEIKHKEIEDLEQSIQDIFIEVRSQMSTYPKRKKLGYNIPDEIKRMDDKSVQLYLDILKEGTEKKRDIRIIIVGKKGSGKTSLTRRLLQESLDGITSTNGIEIHVKHCCITTKDGKWLTGTGRENDNYKSRILQQIVHSGDKDSNQSVQTSEYIPPEKKQALDNSQAEMRDGANDTKPTADFSASAVEGSTTILYERKVDESKSQDLENLEEVLKAPLNDEEFANLFLWDFAGDEEFYNTHQIFLAKDVIYVVVTKLEECSDDLKRDLKFWFDSVHCYVGSTSKSDKCLFPPIIVVGTHTDTFQRDDHLCKQYILEKMESISPHLKPHIRHTILLSNTEDSEEKIDELRQKLFQTAKLGSKWNIEMPLKFVLLEEALQYHKKLKTPILSLEQLQIIAKGMRQPITNDDQLDLLLRYQHELGSLIYFFDIPDFIVLDPQWLADAFRCIISTDKFLEYQLHLPHLEWKEFRFTGRLSRDLIDAIFSQQPNLIQEKKDFILLLMEKFDLIVRPKTLEKHFEDYYVPCMVKEAVNDIAGSYFPDITERTHCLCLSFDFLPPPVFVQLVIACCRRHDLYSSKIIINDKEYPAFFNNVAVFDICASKCEKLMIAMKENVVQLQVWKFGNVKKQSYAHIREFIIMDLKRLLEQRFHVSNVPYKEKLKCPKTNFNTLVGMMDITDMTIGEYRCDEHQEIHKLNDDWFGKQKPIAISKEQMNFVRVGMITVDVMANALYDLLKMEKTIGPQQEYDITRLYGEHRHMNKYTPTKGWGGKTLADIIHYNIGDDIERIRLIRNEMQHAKTYAMDDKKCRDFVDTIADVLKRFDNKIKPAGKTYSARMQEVLCATFTSYDYEQIRENFSQESHHYTADNIEIHHHHHYHNT